MMPLKFRLVVEAEKKCHARLLRLMKSNDWKDFDLKDLNRLIYFLRSYVIRDQNWQPYLTAVEEWKKKHFPPRKKPEKIEEEHGKTEK